MAETLHHEEWFGVAKGATWGTAVDVATNGVLIHLNQPGDSWAITGGRTYAEEMTKNNNTRKMHRVQDVASFAVNGHYDILGQGIQHLIAAFYGASTDSPAEQTSGQADYLHNIDLTASTSKYVTLAGIIESDQSVEAPSAQPTSLSFQFSSNGPLRVACSGVAHSRVHSYSATPQNTKAELAGMTYPAAPDLAFCNGTNLYCRLNTDSGALDNGDDRAIISGSLSLARSPDLSYVFAGANTYFVQQPVYPGGLSTYELSLTFNRLDDGVMDVLGHHTDADTLKAEILVDGDLIGSTLNGSIKFQLPLLQCINAPELQSAYRQRRNPTIVFRGMEAAAAPTGMTDVTLGRIALTTGHNVDLA